ncbi:MAG TPA: DUF4386 family protein [Actinomycetota bacterium]|nr:DUF4386 family protein [Actinomycetota bacterium]
MLVGVLFLTSTAAFSAGSSLVAAHFSGDSPGTTTLLAGVALEVYTGLAVAGIGLAMLPLLARHSLGLARAYLALRVLECLAIVAAGAYMLATRRALDHYDLVIYSFTAVGGIVFSYLLYMTGLVPRLLSMLGLVGYVALLLGIPAALVGLVDLDTGWGMIFLAPGGLFELILPLLLLVRGFSAGGATTSRPSRTSLGQAATVAGLGLLAMSVLAFSSFSAFERLVVEGDAAATARNLVDHQLLLRGITYGFTVVAVLDVVVAWALYALLRPVSRRLALLSAWLRVAYAAGFAAALSNLYVAAGQPGAQASTSLSQFKDGWDLALAVFGLHLLVLGYLVFRSKYMPRVLGVLVMVASLGYLIDSLGALLSERYHANVAAFTFAGEVLLMGWLLWRGRRLQATSVSTSPGVRQGPTGAGGATGAAPPGRWGRSGSGRRPVPGPR